MLKVKLSGVDYLLKMVNRMAGFCAVDIIGCTCGEKLIYSPSVEL